MPVQAPQWGDFLSCPICYNEFECIVRRPISLGCGHTMCKSCLSKLQRKQCPFDQTVSNTDINQLPENHALLQLVGGRVPDTTDSVIPLISKEDFKHYSKTKKCVEDLALYLKSTTLSSTNGISQNSPLSRSMQRKLISLINCQLVEEEGRTRCMRAARSLGDRSVTELILQHQNPVQLSSNLWTAVRARGCQFLGPAMQEEVLKLVLLALEDGSALSRKVLVMFVVQRLAPHFPQASKTSIGHVVQLLYRASCFKLSKCEGDSSLMQLKDDFRTYESLRREHDTQIVQIATEAGLRIAPEQWSSLLYGDTAHKSHMQSIIDKLQTPQSFSQSVQELVIALQRTGDPGNLSILRPHLELLAGIDPSPDAPPPLWKHLKSVLEAARIVVKGLVEFVENFGCRKLQEDRHCLNAKYKTSMCRDLTQRDCCPRGVNCTFAHSQEELEKYRKKKRNVGSQQSHTSSGSPSPDNNVCKQRDMIFPSSSPSDVRLGKHEILKPSTETSLSNHIEIAFKSEISACANPSFSTPGTSYGNSQISEKYPSLLDSRNTSEVSRKLNPESRAFQPLAAKSSLTKPAQSSTLILKKCNTSGPQNCAASFSRNIGIIPGVNNELNSAKLKLDCNKSVSLQASPPNISAHDDTFSLTAPCVNHTSRLVNCKSSKDPLYRVLDLKNQSLETETLAALQHRKKQLLSHLDNANFPKSCTTSFENSPLLSIQTSFCMSKTTEETNGTLFYSPWISSSIFPSSTICTNSNTVTLSSPSSDFESENPKVKLENNLSEIDDSGSLFCPSEKDEFIPFDPPLVSKYGPISRCSKGLIRGAAPIQVNAVSQMGELTSPTSVVCHPLPSASLAPTFFAATPPSFAVPVAIIPEQYLAVVEPSIVVPVAVDCAMCPSKDSDINLISNGRLNERFLSREDSLHDSLHVQNLQLNDFVEDKDLHKNYLKELWEIEKAIQEKEYTIARDGVCYIEPPCRQKYDSAEGGTVPTSIGPWPTETLEHLPFCSSEDLLQH